VRAARPRRLRTVSRLAGVLLTGALLGVSGVAAQRATPIQAPTASKPSYLPYADFTGTDSPVDVTLKQAYNTAVQRYNQALYEYHVTLDKHDQLVELYNRSTSPAESDQAKAEAAPLRARMATLRRDVVARARELDEAARRATAAGVMLK
jgi:multidrug efflux pump subunit AcrA (membrane-fusion protein)